MYPIFLQGTGRTALVVGAGTVGSRKIRQLIASNFRVWMIEPQPTQDFIELAQQIPETLNISAAAFNPALADNLNQQFHLVFACTNNSETNKLIALWAHANGALVNIADNPEASDFANGASFQAEGFTVVISSNGGAPGKTAEFKKRLLELLTSS